MPEERERAMTHRLRSERFEQMVDMAIEGVWTLDRNDRTDYINDRGAAILGYTPEEMLGRPPTDFITPDLFDMCVKGLKDRKRGVPDQREYRWRRKDGSEVWTDFSIRPLIDEDGTYEGVIAVFSDITPRKKAENELYHSRQMLRLVLDSIPNRVFWKDRNLNYLGCNRHAARDAGLDDPSDIVGKSDFELAWRYSADHYREDDRRVIESGIPKINFEERQLQEDGSCMWLRTSKVPLRDQDGMIFGVLGTYEDITERKRNEENLARSNAELQEFAYVASHDLQEPLRMVTAYLALLDRKFADELPPRAKEYMGFAVDGAERMRQLVNDLLEYSRVETRHNDLTTVDMNELVGSVVDDLSITLSEVQGEVYIAPLPRVTADRKQMMRLMTNLISNSIKYRGDLPPRIEVSARSRADEHVFAVRDNGIGIDPRYHDNVFRMFHRLHTKDEYPGTGIGLAIAKKIVERHGGRIWVKSDEGQGATFYFSLPKRGQVST